MEKILRSFLPHIYTKKLTKNVKIIIILTKKVMKCCLQKKAIMRYASSGH